jgi:heme exporter protein D
MTVALQISLFFVGAELFTDFYNEGTHAASVRYLYFGLEGLNSLSPFVWTALAMNLVAVFILSVHPLRRQRLLLKCRLRAGVLRYLDREGHGFRGAGFHPDAARRGLRIQPDGAGAILSAGIWATGILVFTLLARASIAISLGEVGAGPAEAPAADAAPAAA